MLRTGQISQWWKATGRRFQRMSDIMADYMNLFLKIKDGYRHPRSIPVISPSKEFDANVKKIFDKGTCTTFL